jgi:hypothetical protein
MKELHDSRWYRREARHARHKADATSDAMLRDNYLQVAEAYEALADPALRGVELALSCQNPGGHRKRALDPKLAVELSHVKASGVTSAALRYAWKSVKRSQM